MKKNSYYILIFLLFSILISCGKDDSVPPIIEPEVEVEPEVELPQEKDVSFSFSVAEISNKSVGKSKKLNKTSSIKDPIDAVAIIVTIQDESNTIIYDREKLDFNTANDSYLSNTISLDFGNYTITEFIVLDALDNAIYLSPKEGSDMADNVANVLPMSITIGASSTTSIAIEVISTYNLTAENFGYTDFEFTTVGEFTFVVDLTDELGPVRFYFEAINNSEYIIDWGDETTDVYSTSTIIHDYSEQGIYTVTVKGNIKALEYIALLNVGLVDIDLSKLESLKLVALTENLLTSLDVSSNLLLTSLSLYSSNGQLASIDLSNNTQLTTLSLNSNELTSIDLSNNTQLTSLSLSDNQFTSIDLSNNIQLESLYLDKNSQLTNLDISLHTQLENLDLSNLSQSNLENLDLSLYPELVNLILNDNELTSIDVSNNTKLSGLWLWGNQLTDIDLSNNTQLMQFSLEGNQISDINNMELIYSQVLANVKANNITRGYMSTQNNNFDISQTIIDITNELIDDYNWSVIN